MLSLTQRPPQHAIDDVSIWIAPSDPAWDHNRIETERELLAEQAIANAQPGADKDELRKEAVKAHPVNVYQSGATRFALDAPITLPAVLAGAMAVAIVSEYLTGDATEFEIRRPGARNYRRVISSEQSQFTIECVRYGLVRISNVIGADGKPTTFEPPRDTDGSVSEEWMDAVDEQDSGLLTLLGVAIFSLSTQRAVGDEGKP